MQALFIQFLPLGIGLLIFVAVMLTLMLFSNQGEQILDTLTGHYVARLKPEFENQQFPIGPSQFVFAQLGLTLAFFSVGVFSGPDLTTKVSMGVILGAVGFILPRFWLRDQRRRRQELFRQQFADGAALIGNSVRSGMSLPQALEVMVREMDDPMAYEAYRVLQATRVGQPMDQALEHWAERMDNPDLNIFVTAVTIQRQTGGDLGHVLTTLATTVRQRQRIQGQISALTAQGRLGAVVLCLLPVFMGVVLYFMNPERMGLMFSHPLGWGMLAIMGLTISTGYVIVRRIVDIDI